MSFADEFDGHSKEIETVFDLAAFCYDYLVDVTVNQANFLGTYIFEGRDKAKRNPNMDMLLAMTDSAIMIFRKVWKGIAFADCLIELQGLVQKTLDRLADYEDKGENCATIPFWLLKAVDRYAGELDDEDRIEHGKAEPLNDKYLRNSYIYVRRGRMIIEDAAEKLKFPVSISRATIKEQFQYLIILDRGMLQKGMSAPKIQDLLINEQDKDMSAIVSGKHLKLAVIPFSEAEMLDFPSARGGCFRVTYRDKDRKPAINRAVNLLEQAIDRGANIILYPEFVCDVQIQEAIGERLEKLYSTQRDRVKNLLVVLAGSRWDSSDNNVAVWYSYKGRKLGECYKYCNYYARRDDCNGDVEYLMAPGKENTIINVNGIGLLQAGICRDVSDNIYMQQLTSTFVPTLLLVPAWSRSVNIGFQNQMEEIASKNRRTTSVLCNCCEAIRGAEKFKEEVGLFVSPVKKGSIVKGQTRTITRMQGCEGFCPISGCVFLLDLDFSTEAVERGGILADCTQVCPFGH